MVGKLLRDAIGEKSESPWVATDVLVREKNILLPVTLDFRALNSQTVFEFCPMRGKSNFGFALKKETFSMFDLKDGYFQEELAK